MKRILPVIVLTALVLLPLHGESITTTKMELYDTVIRTGADSWTGIGTGNLSVSFNQTNNKSVKSRMELNGTTDLTSGGLSLSVSKAYVKFRFPRLRFVIGKAPFSWGEGLIFNAGDLLFGSSPININLMQSEFTDSTAWITSLNTPLGPFSFIEGIYLAPENLSEGIDSSKEGGRLITRIGNTKLETGYLYSGTDTAHKVYTSLQGNLFLDWHLSAAASLNEDWKESLVITGGMYSMRTIGYDGTLSWRLEAVVKPYDEWKESADASQNGNYGVYIYQEAGYAFNSGMTLILRSMISPVDMSAVITPGFTWNVFQGFTITVMGSAGTGTKNDTFAWKPDSPLKSGFSFMAGISSVY